MRNANTQINSVRRELECTEGQRYNEVHSSVDGRALRGKTSASVPNDEQDVGGGRIAEKWARGGRKAAFSRLLKEGDLGDPGGLGAVGLGK